MRVRWLASLQVPRYTRFPSRSRCVGCANNPRLPWIGLTLISHWRLLCRQPDEPSYVHCSQSRPQTAECQGPSGCQEVLGSTPNEAVRSCFESLNYPQLWTIAFTHNGHTHNQRDLWEQGKVLRGFEPAYSSLGKLRANCVTSVSRNSPRWTHAF
jgi:hypothetical protein